jgi:hypothetical protein
MLKCLGSTATSNEGGLSVLHKAGQFFIVPITTGTSHSAASIGRISTYQIFPVPLPVLKSEDQLLLATSCLNTKCLDGPVVERIINEKLFQLGLGDTGGLPGLIFFLCSKEIDSATSYVQHLHNSTKSYVGKRWDSRWKVITSVFFARPHVGRDTVLMREFVAADQPTATHESLQHLQEANPNISGNINIMAYTVQDALDGGTILLHNESEIGLAPALLAKFNGDQGIFNPILTQEISSAQDWTWQIFEKAHLLYLAATMRALIDEAHRFDHNITLGTYLRHVNPSTSPILSRKLVLPSSFERRDYVTDEKQCIPKSNAKRERRISILFNEFEHMYQAANGTPVIDGYQNLKFAGSSSTTVSTTLSTMFIQYKHSALQSNTSDVNVSSMNAEVLKLHRLLLQYEWPEDREWFFLWITNRKVVPDTTPDSRLLWVEQSTMVNHAPLLGFRGLVPTEDLRKEEE